MVSIACHKKISGEKEECLATMMYVVVSFESYDELTVVEFVAIET